MPNSKLFTLSEAIKRFIPDDSSIAMGLSLEALIPFAAAHEIIRQHKRNLTLIGPISDMLFDQLIGADCVRKIRAAWVGNVITGSGYNFRRGIETSTLRIEDHSNLTIALALRAGQNKGSRPNRDGHPGRQGSPSRCAGRRRGAPST